MEKFLKTIEKKDVDELFTSIRRLKALLDIKASLNDTGPRIFTPPPIRTDDIDRGIREMEDKRERMLEHIRRENGWTGEFMDKIHIMEDCRVFIKESART